MSLDHMLWTELESDGCSSSSPYANPIGPLQETLEFEVGWSKHKDSGSKVNLLCRVPASSIRQVCAAATQALLKVGTACWGLVVHSCKPCRLQALQIMSITDGVEELFGPALGPEKCATHHT